MRLDFPGQRDAAIMGQTSLCETDKSPIVTLTYLTKDRVLIKACTSLLGLPHMHWDSHTAEKDFWKQSKTIKVITR